MPTTRQTKKTSKPSLPKITAPKLKASLQRTLSDSNLHSNTPATPKATHTPASQPTPNAQSPSSHDTSTQTDIESPSPNRTAQASDTLSKYPNHYGITLTLSPTNNQPNKDTQEQSNHVTQATAPNTDTHTPTDAPIDTDQPHAPTNTDSPIILSQPPRSKIPDPPAPNTEAQEDNAPRNDPITITNSLHILKTKQTKILHHLSFLNSATQLNIVPHGFRISTTPQVMDSSQTDIQEQWEKQLIDTSKSLMSLTHRHYTSLLATINEKITELEALLDKIQIDTRTTELTLQQTHKLQLLESKLSATREKKIETLTTHKNTQPTKTNRPTHPAPRPFLARPQSHQQKHFDPRHPYAPPTMRKVLLPTPPMPPMQLPPHLAHGPPYRPPQRHAAFHPPPQRYTPWFQHPIQRPHLLPTPRPLMPEITPSRPTPLFP